ncbi:hypothetical protein FQZ97_873470 [compost metagenome]
MVHRVAHAGLGRQVHDALEAVGGKQPGHGVAVGQVQRVEHETRLRLQLPQTGLLQAGFVVGVQVVQAVHLQPQAQQALAQVKADETGGAGDEHGACGVGGRNGHGRTPRVTGR